MKQEILDRIAEIESTVAKLEKEISAKQKEIKSLESERYKITRRCDHTYPDGMSARIDQWLNTECKICKACD